MGIVEDATKKEEDKAEIESRLELAVRNIIENTTYELIDEPYGMERRLHEGV